MKFLYGIGKFVAFLCETSQFLLDAAAFLLFIYLFNKKKKIIIIIIIIKDSSSIKMIQFEIGTV